MLTEGIFKGSRIFSGSDLLLYSNLKFGSTQKLFNISLFENISFIELFPYSGIKLARAAGVSSKIISKDNEKSVLKLTSG
jgi:ribosomal protein L2